MFKGIVFFIKNGWKYDKLYIIWRLLFQFINSLIPIVAVIIPKYMIDELMGAQNVSKLTLYVAVLAGYTLIATCLSNYWNWDAFSRRCRVSAEFDSDLHRRLAEADFERLEDPHFLDMQEKAKKFLYCDWHGFGYLLDCAMMIIGQCFTLIGISAVIITLDWRIIVIFVISLIISTKLEGVQKKKAMRLSQEISRDQRGWQYYSELFEDFSYGKEIRMNCIQNWLLSRERGYFTKVNSNLKQQNDTYIKAGNLGALFTFLQQIIAYGYLLACIVQGAISIGSFTMYTSAVTAFASSFRRVMESIIEIRAYDMYYDDLNEYLDLDVNKNLKILEIGCGPGALASALHRWYPYAEITAVDRDSEFIRFATEHEPEVNFVEGDATTLPFEDNTFDVTISNTVAEHIEPSKFYGEQVRVLKRGGVCLVLSSRKGIHINPKCTTSNEYERQFWKKAEQYNDSMDRFAVCKYPMSEAEIPTVMAEYGFSNISTGFITVDLTPDNPRFSVSLALDMINANRYTALDAIESVLHTMPEHFTTQEVEEIKRLANAKYDVRIEQYKRGEKQWDTNVSIIMVIRGIK